MGETRGGVKGRERRERARVGPGRIGLAASVESAKVAGFQESGWGVEWVIVWYAGLAPP
jgi:hypothetical protein